MNSKPWFSDGKRDIIKNPHNPHRVRCSINLYWQPVVRSSVFVYRNECLPQKQPCFPASAPVNSKMAGTDVTSYQSSSQKKSKRPHPGALILSQTPEGGEGKRGQMPHICPGSPPSGLTMIGALYVSGFLDFIPLCNTGPEARNLSLCIPRGWLLLQWRMTRINLRVLLERCIFPR